MVRAFTHYCGNRAHPLLVFGFIAKKIRAIALSSESRVLTTSRFARRLTLQRRLRPYWSVDRVALKLKLVVPVGFEPTTNDLKGRCSTIELQDH